MLRDLCLSTGASFITREDGVQLKDIRLHHFGQAKKISDSGDLIDQPASD